MQKNQGACNRKNERKYSPMLSLWFGMYGQYESLWSKYKSERDFFLQLASGWYEQKNYIVLII